jgi:hypothetical protein
VELVTEPPAKRAGLHVRWCERRAAAPPSYSIQVRLKSSEKRFRK